MTPHQEIYETIQAISCRTCPLNGSSKFSTKEQKLSPDPHSHVSQKKQKQLIRYFLATSLLATTELVNGESNCACAPHKEGQE
jgi:hypothetical protein